jgi:hypothetical protein
MRRAIPVGVVGLVGDEVKIEAMYGVNTGFGVCSVQPVDYLWWWGHWTRRGLGDKSM